MKTIFLTLGLLITSLSFGQKIIIHVFEKQEMSSYRKTTLDSVIINPDYVGNINYNHTRYVLDLNEMTSTYSSDSSEVSVLPIKYVKFGNDLLKINIIEDGFDYGLMVNTKEESVLWYWISDYQTMVKKITRCYFEKPS
jgi:hypothetical protein